MEFSGDSDVFSFGRTAVGVVGEVIVVNLVNHELRSEHRHITYIEILTWSSGK